MRYFAVMSTLVFFFASCCEGFGQAPVLSTPFEDATSSQLMQPLSQTTGSHGGAGWSAYGTVNWSIEPIDATVGSLLPVQTTQPQSPAGLASFGGVSSGGLISSASSWTAGSAAGGGIMLNRIGNSSQGASYTSASSFAPRALAPIGTGTGDSTPSLPSSLLPQAQGLQEQGSQAQQLQAQGMQGSRSDQLLKQTAAFVPGAPKQFQAAPLSGDFQKQSTGMQANGSSTGASQSTQAKPSSDTDDGNDSSQLFAVSSWPHTQSAAPGTFNVPLVTAPTSEGMAIRLLATADGLQLVLQTRNSLNGSILADQSGISRHGGNIEDGWWAWGAGAGSWAPINAVTSSPLTKFSDPGESLINSLVPTSKLDIKPENSGGASPEE